jgi:hypothetical protein
VQWVGTDFDEPGLLEWPEIAEDDEHPPPPALLHLDPPAVAKDRPKLRTAYKGHSNLSLTSNEVPNMSTGPQDDNEHLPPPTFLPPPPPVVAKDRPKPHTAYPGYSDLSLTSNEVSNRSTGPQHNNEHLPPPVLLPSPLPAVTKDHPNPSPAYKGHADLPSTADKVPDMST